MSAVSTRACGEAGVCTDNMVLSTPMFGRAVYRGTKPNALVECAGGSPVLWPAGVEGGSVGAKESSRMRSRLKRRMVRASGGAGIVLTPAQVKGEVQTKDKLTSDEVLSDWLHSSDALH